METKKQVVPAKSAGLLAFLLRILGLPFSLGNVIYTFLFTKNLKNCLPGKVVLITGASSGLGEALAHTFYIAGCKVILAARRQDELERVRKDLLQQHSVSISYRKRKVEH
jgi:dehydrogenase/reductase SDR family member 7B